MKNLDLKVVANGFYDELGPKSPITVDDKQQTRLSQTLVNKLLVNVSLRNATIFTKEIVNNSNYDKNEISLDEVIGIYQG